MAEAEAHIAAKLVKIQSEIPVQQERIKQVRQQLKADVVAPAEANCKRAIAQARGEAAQIIEDGKAQAEGTRSLAESWKAAGDNARDIFLMQKLDTLMKTLTATVPEISVQNVTIVDTQQGGPVAKTASFVEQLRQTTGIDLASAVNSLATSHGNHPLTGTTSSSLPASSLPASSLPASMAAVLQRSQRANTTHSNGENGHTGSTPIRPAVEETMAPQWAPPEAAVELPFDDLDDFILER